MHKNISDSVYWYDVCVSSWKLSGNQTQGQQSVPKIAQSTVKVHLVWHDAYICTEVGSCCVLLLYSCIKSAHARATDLHCSAQILLQ
jgi:hypothetical protein